MKLQPCLETALSNPETGWTMGSFGAIAEFHHVAGDAMPVPPAPLTQVTDRGGVRIERVEDVVPVAWEMLSPKSHRWSQGISLCLPEADAMMNQRDVLTRLGPDTGALRAADRGAVLYDMGLAQPQVDFCIRTADPELIAVLDAANGRSLFEHNNPAMGAILKAHPHRVALTPLGRVEVYQMIGGPDTGGSSPEGPHTHVLPKLLRAARTHSANTPIPEGLIPCGSLHPENPVIDRMGRDKDFNPAAYDAFQAMLQAWGCEDYTQTKARVVSAIRAKQAPDAISLPDSRLARTAIRNAIRQLRRLGEDSPMVAIWASAYDQGAPEAAEEPLHQD